MAKHTDYLVAAVYEDNASQAIGDAIGRGFVNDNQSRFVRMDVWPISDLWSRQAFFIPKELWIAGSESPQWDFDHPIEQVGVVSIVCEQMNEKAKINRKIGFVFRGQTQYGETDGISFYSIPANPNWYQKGTLSVFINEPSPLAAA